MCRNILGAFAKIAKSDYSLRLVCLSVCMEQLGSHWDATDKILHLRLFSKICRENSNFIQMRQKKKGTLHEDVFTFVTISRWVLEMRNVSNESYRQNQNTLFFRKSIRLWDNVKKFGVARVATNAVTTWRTRVACWISKATRMHTPTQTGTHTHARPHTHMATTVTLTCLNVTSYVHCLYCLVVVNGLLKSSSYQLPYCNINQLCILVCPV